MIYIYVCSCGFIAIPGDDRQVVVLELRAKFKDRPDGDIVIPLKTDADVEKAKHTVLVMKEGSTYNFATSFVVQHDVCMGLKYNLFVYKMGVRVDKQSVSKYFVFETHTW